MHLEAVADRGPYINATSCELTPRVLLPRLLVITTTSPRQPDYFNILLWRPSLLPHPATIPHRQM